MHAVVPPVKQTRKERAQATRARIADAAGALFAERGYQATTMSQIAAQAGVAVQTVHFVFHTKPELLQEVVSRAVLGEAGAPERQEWFRQLGSAPNGRSALALVLDNVLPILTRVAPIAWVMRAVPDEDVAAVFAHNERLRREGYGRMISVLADKRWLREDLDEQHATDVLLFLLSAESFRTLVTDYAWSVDTWRDWTLETLADQLLREP